MTDTITITAGRERQGDEQDFNGPDGTYASTLVSVTDIKTETSTMPSKRKDDDGTWSFRDWTFAIDDGSEYDGQIIELRANAKAGSPRSKQFAIIAALTGRTPTVGAQVDIKRHLVGRRCYLSIQSDDQGWPRIAALMAIPPDRKAAPPVELPKAAADAGSQDDLPF